MTPHSANHDGADRVARTAELIKKTFDPVPRVAMILGSGLGSVTASIDAPRTLPFDRIEGFPVTRVAGHAGQLLCGELVSTPLLVQQGRVHYYEGHPMDMVVLLTRALALAGVKVLVVTNAAGGVSPDLKAGDLMRLTDHLNLMGANPLTGPHNENYGPRFPDLSRAYDPDVGAILDQAASDSGHELHTGIYAAFSGPSYETPAEIRMVRSLGASAVGMSTVPEVIAATQMGVRAGAISCIANSAAGMSHQGISHDEVLDVTAKASVNLAAILEKALPRLHAL